jgi:hypothetical protein
MQALAISSPTPLSRKNRVYSRRRLVRARCRKVQCRFMKNDEVAATATEAVLAPMADQPEPQVQQVGQAEVEDGVDGADNAELGQLVGQVSPAPVEACDDVQVRYSPTLVAGTGCPD